MDEKLDGEEIHDREAEDHAPEDGMGPDEGAVGESQHGYDEEENQHAVDFVPESTNYVEIFSSACSSMCSTAII